MVSTINRTQTRPVLFKIILKGIIAAVIITILGSMLLTTFAVSGSLNEARLELSTIVLLGIAMGIGGKVTGKATPQKKLIAVGLYILGAIILLLVLNLILWDWEFENILYKIAAILAGGSLGVLGRGQRSKLRRKIRNR